MNFGSLHYFLVAAEELNFTRAAAKLFISQQALSDQINRLEKDLGVALFIRSPRLNLTYAGRQLVRYAADAVNLERQIRQTAGDISNQQSGEIRLGISHTCGRAILPFILPKYRSANPLINISLFEGNSSELEMLLEQGKLDLIITYAPLSLNGVKTIELIRERLFLVAPQALMHQHFGESYESIRSRCLHNLDLSLFASLPFILLKKGNRIRTKTDLTLKKHGVTPNILLETENIGTAFALAQKNMGLTVYPELFYWCIPSEHSAQDQGVDFFPLQEDNTINTLVAARMANQYEPRAVTNLIELCQQTLQEIYSSKSVDSSL